MIDLFENVISPATKIELICSQILFDLHDYTNHNDYIDDDHDDYHHEPTLILCSIGIENQ